MLRFDEGGPPHRPIRHRKCGYILVTDQSDAEEALRADQPARRTVDDGRRAQARGQSLARLYSIQGGPQGGERGRRGGYLDERYQKQKHHEEPAEGLEVQVQM
eukprot:6622901-Pyramimonas_sp.AAC.1